MKYMKRLWFSSLAIVAGVIAPITAIVLIWQGELDDKEWL